MTSGYQSIFYMNHVSVDVERCVFRSQRSQKNHLLFVPCMVLYKISPVFITFSTTIYVTFCSTVFFCLFVLLLIAMLCHCSVCVRLSHLIKDYLLTYLLLIYIYVLQA